MAPKRRILIVDDNSSIHDDFRKILVLPIVDSRLDQIEQLLFKKERKNNEPIYEYVIDDAYQGTEAIDMVQKAEDEGFPYSLVFMDVRMPPGIDGVETIDLIWKKFPNIEMVICSAYSDYSWDEILDKFGQTDKLLFVKKPFNIIVVKQLALSLITKWDIAKKNRNYMDLLEKEVEERTKELSDLLEGMRILKEKAEEADKQKSAFLSNMSHEIRSPMNSILGFAELLTENDFPREARIKYLKYISNSGNSLLHLIDDIIYNAKIEAGVLKVEKEEFELNEMLGELFAKMELEKGRSDKPDVKLVLELDSKNELIVNADHERLKQVLINLLNNAIKFTLSGTITFGYKIEDNKWFRFFVKDTGIGIPEGKLSKIFERFGQVDDQQIRKSKGTGLGLSISKNLVELMGGEINVKSTYNVGTEFFFTIPYDVVESDKFDGQEIEVLGNTTTFNPSCTILIAEDEDVNWFFLYHVLKETGVKLHRALNGEEAVEYIKNGNRADLVLMDIKMPVMNGIEAMKKIKELKPDLPVIAQTAFALNDEERKNREQGFDEYITKPIDIKFLLKKVAYYMTKK